MLLSATFQFTIVNFKKLYRLGLLLNMTEKVLDLRPRKSAFKWVRLEAIWSNRLGDLWQQVQHTQAETVSAASGKWLLLAYYPLP